MLSDEFLVVVNHEGQYSLWPIGRAVPSGWTATECSGPKDACLTYINQVWTDMRPLSLREAAASRTA